MYNEPQEISSTPKIKVIGVGGAGNNAVNRMIEDNIKGVTYYLLNTETGTLKRAKTKNILQIGIETTKGLGAGANENVGERAAIENKEQIKTILQKRREIEKSEEVIESIEEVLNIIKKDYNKKGM